MKKHEYDEQKEKEEWLAYVLNLSCEEQQELVSFSMKYPISSILAYTGLMQRVIENRDRVGLDRTFEMLLQYINHIQDGTQQIRELSDIAFRKDN